MFLLCLMERLNFWMSSKAKKGIIQSQYLIICRILTF